jgi:hypothetical protein
MQGYTVHGIVRRTSNLLRSRIEHLRRDQKLYGRRFFLHYGDLYDSSTLSRIVAEVQVIWGDSRSVTVPYRGDVRNMSKALEFIVAPRCPLS